MGKIKPIIPQGEEKPVKLRVPPKECKACGGKFIPVKGWTQYCPACRRLPQKKREAMRDARELHPEMPKEDVKVYIDESLKKAAAEPSDPIQEEEDMKKTFEPIEAKPVEELEEIVQSAPAAKPKDAFLDALLKLIHDQFGVDLIPADEYMPATLTVDGKAFSGLYIKKSTWEGIEK